MSSRLPALLWGASLLTLAVKSSAQSTEPIEIGVSFSAAEECANVEAFAEKVTARLPSLRLASRQEADLRVSLEAGDDGGVEAELLILLKGGEQLTRTLQADDCKSALEAIAFVAAVALDPGAPDPIELRSETTRTPTRPSRAAKQPPTTTPPEASSQNARALGSYWDILVGARLQMGAAPGPLYGSQLGVSFGSRNPGIWSPSATVSLGWGAGNEFVEESGTAVFVIAPVGLALCPIRLAAGPLDWRLCAAGQVGLLWARGKDTVGPARSTRLWASVGASSDLGVSLTRRLRLFGEAGAFFPLIRDEYQFDSQVFHQVAAFSFQAVAGLAVRF